MSFLRAFLFLLCVLSGVTSASVPAQAQPLTRGYVTSDTGEVSNVGTTFPFDTVANTLLTPFAPQGRNPRAVTTSPDGSRVYVRDELFTPENVEDVVSVYNAVTRDLITHISLEERTNLFGDLVASPDGRFLYFGTQDSETVNGVLFVFDAIEERLIEKVDLTGIGQGPFSIAVTPDSSRIYIGIEADGISPDVGFVLAVDAETRDVVARIPLPGGTGSGVAITPDGSTVWASSAGAERSVVLIDVATNRIFDTVQTDTPIRNLVITADGARVYGTSLLTDEVLVMDAQTREVVTRIPVADALELAITPDGATVFVSTRVAGGNDGIAVIDTATNTEVETIVGLQRISRFGLDAGFIPVAPTLAQVDPGVGSAAGGTEVTLRGDGFAEDTEVLFGLERAVVVEVTSAVAMTVITPPNDVGPVDVIVRNPAGQAGLLRNGFEYVLPDGPEIVAIDPAIGDINGGEPVVLRGSGFDDETVVTFGGRLAEVVDVQADAIEVITPPQTQEGPVDVIVRDRFNQEARGTFDYVRAGFPEIVTVNPAQVSTAGGEEVTLTGAFFAEGLTLTLEAGGEVISVEARVDSSTQLRFTTPSFISGDGCSPIDVTITVTNPSQDLANATLTYEPAQVARVAAGSSIQRVIDATVPGACLLVEAGLFVENLVIGAQPVSLISVTPTAPQDHVIQAENPLAPVVTITGNAESGTLVKGFAIVRGNGGVEIDASTPRLENLLIQNNLRDGDGGGIAVRNGSIPTLRQIDIRTNLATGSGGGIFVAAPAENGPASEVRFRENVEVVGNQADRLGGGLFLPAGTTAQIPVAEFSANTAEAGGGIFAGTGSEIEISDAIINDNIVEAAGGGIFMPGVTQPDQGPSSLKMTNTQLDGNRAAADGGGLHMGVRGTLTIQGGSISRNATEGSGVGVFLAQDAQVAVDGVTLEANAGLAFTAFGGGLFASNFVTGTVRNTRIIGNTAQQGGGAFLAQKTGLDFIDNPEIRDNRVTVLPGEQGEEETPVRGPGLLSIDSESDFIGNVITDNQANGATELTGGLHLIQPFLVPEIINNVIENNTDVQLICAPDRSEVVLDGNTIPGGIVGCQDASVDFR